MAWNKEAHLFLSKYICSESHSICYYFILINLTISGASLKALVYLGHLSTTIKYCVLYITEEHPLPEICTKIFP